MNRALAVLALYSMSACQCGPPEQVDVATFCSFETGETLACQRDQACAWLSPHIACRPSWNARSQTRLAFCPENPEASVDAGRIRFDGARAAACLREASLQCQSLESCTTAIVGLVPQGGACSTGECAAGLTCNDSTCPSTCQPLPCPGQQQLGDGGCGPLSTGMGVSLGGACNESAPCDERLRCHKGRCVWNRAQEGAACDTTFVIDRWCQGGLFCVDGRCSRGAAPGEPCSMNNACRVDSYCGLDGGCVLAPTEGAACDGQCAVSMSCTAGTCKQSPFRGTPCVSDPDCGGTLLRCEAGRCVRACN